MDRDKKQAAQAYCVIATKLEAAQLVLQDSKEVVDKIYVELEKLRVEMGEGLEKHEILVILLPDNLAVVVSQHGKYVEADIGKVL